MRIIHYFIIIFACAIVLQSCRKQDAEIVNQPDASTYSSQVAVDWMQTIHEIIRSEAKSPPQASRIYAYSGIALYQAALPGMQHYQTLEGQVAGLTNLPKPEMFGQLDYTVTVNEAVYQITSKIFGVLKPENVSLIEALHTKYVTQEAGKASYEVNQNSADFGKMVAIAVMNRANNDNFAETRNLLYTVPSALINPAFWSPTDATGVSPLEPYWGKIKCFAMPNSTDCTIQSTTPFDESAGSAFYNQANEVYTTGLHLTDEQKAIAYWWSDGAATATPPGHWVAIADQLATRNKMTLTQAAEMYALLNITLGDAFISCWDEKYKLNLLRPVTYIHQYIAPNSNWQPLLTTPAFPEYPSGHSVASAAAAEVLTSLLGNQPFTDSVNTYLGLTARSYNSFNEAADEAAISRLYGGIHFREAIENGQKQGKEVGLTVLKNIKLKM